MGIEDDIARADESPYVRELEAIAKGDELQRESEARKAELERLRGEVLDLRGKHSAALASYRADVVKLMDKNALQRKALDRFGKEQVRLVRALRALVDVCQDVRDEEGWPEGKGAMWERMKEAREVLALVEPPFG